MHLFFGLRFLVYGLQFLVNGEQLTVNAYTVHSISRENYALYANEIYNASEYNSPLRDNRFIIS